MFFGDLCKTKKPLKMKGSFFKISILGINVPGAPRPVRDEDAPGNHAR